LSERKYLGGFGERGVVDFEGHFDVAARGFGIRAHLMRFGDQRFGHRFFDAGERDVERGGKRIVTAFLVKADIGHDRDLAHFDFFAFGDAFKRAAETRGIAGGEKLLGVGAGFAVGGREVEADALVVALDVAGAATDGSNMRGV
jgi:hypothetical protein